LFVFDDSAAEYNVKTENKPSKTFTAEFSHCHLMSRLPCNEPDCFDGSDVTMYTSFILSFQRIIEDKCTNDVDRFYYLLHYTKGKAHDLVLSCNGPSPLESYRKARELLRETFGDEFIIAHTYLEKLENWPSVASDDLKALTDFSVFLSSICNMMKNMSYFSQLNSLKEIKNVVMKLPYDMRK